jgi:hypothetical protein
MERPIGIDTGTMASPKLRKTQELTRYFQVHWVAFRAIGCSQVFSRKPEYRSGSDVPHGARAGALCSERMRRFPVARSWVRRHVPGFWRATRFGSNLLPRPGYVGNGLQCLSIASVSPDTAASFNKNAEPVNTDSSHRSSHRAIILMTGLALASFCRQDEGTIGQVKRGSAT